MFENNRKSCYSSDDVLSFRPVHRRLPAARRRRRKHKLHQLERRGLGGNSDAPAAQEEAAKKPHLLHTGADRGAGERC